MSENKELQNELFPNGKPTNEEFISVIANLVRERLKSQKPEKK